jgi:hypothetical protein
MAKAELNIDISENTVKFAVSSLEAWLNYNRGHRGVVFKKDADDKYSIMLWDEDAGRKAPEIVAYVACPHCGKEQYWQGKNKCISCGKTLSF